MNLDRIFCEIILNVSDDTSLSSFSHSYRHKDDVCVLQTSKKKRTTKIPLEDYQFVISLEWNFW